MYIECRAKFGEQMKNGDERYQPWKSDVVGKQGQSFDPV